MPLSLDSLAYEIQYGGPHVHLVVFIICQIIGIILLHYVFRIITYLINRYTSSSSITMAVPCARSCTRPMPSRASTLASAR